MTRVSRFGLLITLLALAMLCPLDSRAEPTIASAPETAMASAPETIPSTPGTAQKLPRMVDLGAGSCQSCKKMKPILEEAGKLFAGTAIIEFIDVWINKDEAGKYGVRMIPTQVFFDAEGKEVWRHEGFLSLEDIQKQFSAMGVTLKQG